MAEAADPNELIDGATCRDSRIEGIRLTIVCFRIADIRSMASSVHETRISRVELIH